MPAEPEINFGKVEEDVLNNMPAEEAVLQDVISIKTGYKTSEFWITLATDVATLAGGLLPANSPWVKGASAVATAVVTMTYVISRIRLKKHVLSAQALSHTMS